jgi:hypothetical protein
MKDILFWILITAQSTTLLAQSGGAYDLSWNTIDGGGGTSTGGAYALSGTIGQPDAGAMSGGNYSLSGGFWGAVQTPPPVGSVIISVRVVGDEVRLRFTGIPGRIYYVERAHSVTGPWPDVLAAITMPSDGVVEFVDTTAFFSPKSFYRTSTD